MLRQSTTDLRGRTRLLRRAALATALTVSVAGMAVAAPPVGAVTGEDTISTVAGDGNYGDTGNGGPAADAQVSPNGYLAVAPPDSLYADTVFFTDGTTIRTIGPDGTIRRFAGGGSQDPAEGGVSALDASFGELAGIAVGPDATVYVAVNYPGAVYAIAPNGAVTRRDGPGSAEAYLDTLRDIEVDAAGRVYAVDSAQHVVYRIETSGSLTLMIGVPRTLGSGLVYDNSTDPPTPVNRKLNNPRGVALSPSGSTLYVADTNNHGVVSSPVGSPGESDYISPSPLAFGNQTSFVTDVDVDGNGGVYAHARARIVRLSGGSATLLAGNGTSGFSGDGGPASASRLSNQNGGVAVSADADRLYLTDGARIRRIGDAPPPPNDAPLAQAGPDVAGNTDVPVALDGTASDADGTVASAVWTVAPGTPCTLTDADQADASITCSAAGTYTATLTVTDDRGATASDSAIVSITSLEVGTTTTAKPTFVRGEKVTVTVTIPVRPKTARPTGSAVFTVDGGSPVTVPLNSAGKALFSFVPPSIGSYTVAGHYNGDARYGAGSTGSVTFSVVKGASTTVAKSLLEPVPSGRRAWVTSRSLIVAPAKTTLTGSIVTFTAEDGIHAPITGSLPVNSAGSAQWRPVLPDGTWLVTATYQGNDDIGGSISNTVTVHVGS